MVFIIGKKNGPLAQETNNNETERRTKTHKVSRTLDMHRTAVKSVYRRVYLHSVEDELVFWGTIA